MRLTIKNLTNLLILLLVLAAWWLTAKVINPELHYFLQQSAFLTNHLFFKSFTTYPGGLADYGSEFIAQFFYFKTWGSFLIILVASLQGIIAIDLVRRIAGKVKLNLNLSIFTLILLLSVLVQCNYFYPFYASMRLLIASGFVWIFTVLTSKFPGLRFYMGFILAMLLFYVAGGAALFTFALSVVLIHIRFYGKKEDVFTLPFFILGSAFMPYLAYKYIFLVNLPLVYSITHSKTPLILSYIPDFKLYTLYALLPAFLLGAVLFSWFKRKYKKAVHQKLEIKPVNVSPKTIDKKVLKKSENKPPVKLETPKRKPADSTILWMLGQFTVIVVLAIGSIYFTIDRTERDKILVSFYGANGDWDKVIKTAESIEKYDLFINFEYNRALANKGQLADNLFNYTQLAGPAALFMDGTVSSDIPFICSDQYYDLGFMHESQHWAFEAQTIFPNSPRLMKRLVEINLVSGKYQLAEKFLRRLDENMIYHDWVEQHQKFIDDTSLVSKDPAYSWKRKCEPVDAFTASNSVQKLTKLLEANPANKLALDYLLCSTLLDGDLGTFKSLLAENRNFAKTPLPRSWDEAMVLYQYIARKAPQADDIQFTQGRQDQFISFIKAIKPFGNDWQSASRSLQKDFGTTYWYYIKCLNPKITKAKIKRQ
ncbi:MAG TPA: DUF6057 family protein [Prolixibacteraceae bacterium]|jgi:hypothetical protein